MFGDYDFDWSWNYPTDWTWGDWGYTNADIVYDTGVNDPWWKIEEQNYDSSMHQYGIITTYYDDGTRSKVENDLKDNQWYENVTYWFDARGNLTLQTGVTDAGDTWTSSIANGRVQSWTTFDGGVNEVWAKIDYRDLDVSTGNWGLITAGSAGTDLRRRAGDGVGITLST